MFLKIILVISLVNICSCATPTYPEGKSNQAVYSQSFEREDVPLSYKYSAVHVYNSTPKKEPSQKIGIQFAPLPGQYDERVKFVEDSEKTITTEQPTGPTDQTINPPKLQLVTNKSVHNNPVTSAPASVSQYIPRHNINVMQSDRNPFASYQIIPNSEKQNMGHYLEQFWSYDEPQRLIAFSSYNPKLVGSYALQATQSPKPALYTSGAEPQPNLPFNSFMQELSKQLDQRQGRKAYPPKVPQMHLNIGQGRKYPTQYQRTGNTHLSQARFYAYPVLDVTNTFVHPQKKNRPSDSKNLQPLPNHLHLSAYSRT